MTALDSISLATFSSDIAISLRSFANIRSPSLSCARLKSCVLAFWLLMFNQVLNAPHLRMKASHVSWLIPQRTLVLVEVHLALQQHLMPQNSFHDPDCQEACKLNHWLIWRLVVASPNWAVY